MITCHLKDLIIIRGRNHYPQDIELTVEQSHAILRRAGGAAFSVEVRGRRAAGGRARIRAPLSLRRSDRTESADARRIRESGAGRSEAGHRRSLPARLEQWVKPQVQAEVAPQTNKAVVQMARPNLQTAYVAPRTETEQRIAQVWQNVLGLEQVGVYDSFFELGGNSLAGVQAIAQINAALGVQIPTVSLYESPTIHTLSKLVEQQMGAVPREEPAYEAQRSRGERRRARAQQRRET